ncbi:MAG: hypothetical protein ABIH83_01320, partial [Candidatus Micrarchaeota archaeon]
MKHVFLTSLFVIGMLFLAGCCSQTVSNSAKADPYEKYYGKTVKYGDFTIQLDKYRESISGGEKDITVTFTVLNDGAEKDSPGGAMFITDSNGRNYEANPFLCSMLINPGIEKTVDCKFLEIPVDAEIVAIKAGDSMFQKGSYITLFELSDNVGTTTKKTTTEPPDTTKDTEAIAPEPEEAGVV